MDSNRYYRSNPGLWNTLDRKCRETLFMDISNASWVNITLSGVKGRMNMLGDTVLTFPDHRKVHRLYSFQSYKPLRKSDYPKENVVALRQFSPHYELQKNMPVIGDESETLNSSFEPGWLVQIGQSGGKPIDTDFIIRFSPQSRLKMSTNVPDATINSRVNHITMTYQLETPLTNYEMSFSTANEIDLKFVRSITPFLSFGGQMFSKHYPIADSQPPPGTKIPQPVTKSSFATGCRWSNTNRFGMIEGSRISNPIELTGFVNFGSHYGLSFAGDFFPINSTSRDQQANEGEEGSIKVNSNNIRNLHRLSIAAMVKRRFRTGETKVSIGAKYVFEIATIPSFLKVVVGNHNGIGSYFGMRLSNCLGIGLAAQYDPSSFSRKFGLFFDL